VSAPAAVVMVSLPPMVWGDAYEDIHRAEVAIGRVIHDAAVAKANVVATSGGDSVIGHAAQNDVVASLAGNDIVAADVGISGGHRRDDAASIVKAATVAEHPVMAKVGIDGVVGRPTQDGVVPTGSGNGVVAAIACVQADYHIHGAEVAISRVIHGAAIAEQDVVAARGGNDVVGHATENRVIPGFRGDDVVAADGGGSRFNLRTNAADVVDLATIAKHHIVAKASVNDIVGGSAQNRVISGGDSDGVVTADVWGETYDTVLRRLSMV
jgi:hypothetical protein